MKPNNDTFDFSSIGKRMPYRTPDGFFEANKQRLVEKAQTAAANEESAAEKKSHAEIHTIRGPQPWKKMMMGAAATIALLVASYGIARWATADSISPADTASEAIMYASSATYDTYADDGEDWSDFADADIFFDCWD